MTIQDAIEQYKNNFSACWNDEKYKWKAVKHFQEVWNPNAKDFAKMAREAFSQAFNLLQGSMYYPFQMLNVLAIHNPELLREAFNALYDESKDIDFRIKDFRSQLDYVLADYRKANPDDIDKIKNHYQDLRAITVYLSFRYPEKYFLYKSRMYSDFKKLINFKSFEQKSELKNYMLMCQQIVDVVKKDTELIQLQRQLIEKEGDCYEDSSFHILVQTIIYFCVRYAKDEMKSSVADEDIETTHYWIYSPGDNASLWDECYKKGIMAIGWSKIGDLRAYKSKDEIKRAMKDTINAEYTWKNGAHAAWQFANDMKPGDIVCAKKGTRLVIGRGVVESDYEYDSTRSSFKSIRKVKWLNKGEYPHPGNAVVKTLTDITQYTDYVEKLNNLFNNEESEEEGVKENDYPIYDAEGFLEEVFMTEKDYSDLVNQTINKQNIILQGAPGVGKTFVAKRLAYSIMGVKDYNRVMMVQFHQSYSYEDFIMGFRPSSEGFELKKGAFYNFCKTAEIDSDNKYFFIIDEINRGNISKIFGELFMLIEKDKRDVELQLLYSDEKFSVPRNVYIIGTMNTADRSLAMLDYALRRRFSFFELRPGFNTEGFKKYRNYLANEKFDNLINCIENLNVAIAADESLGEGFCIGHSYFCNLKKDETPNLSGIVEYELIPLLKEYWFDEPTKVKDWSNNLRSAIK